jgi:hypothetical protein
VIPTVITAPSERSPSNHIEPRQAASRLSHRVGPLVLSDLNVLAAGLLSRRDDIGTQPDTLPVCRPCAVAHTDARAAFNLEEILDANL